MSFERKHKHILIERIEQQSRKFIQVLYGPRQVGKTTIVNQFLNHTKLPYHYASADAVILSYSGWLSQQWETARFKLKQSQQEKVLLVLDEIQKINNWSEFVKKEWDADTRSNIQVKVILLGSSRLLLQKGLTESLAGRFEATYVNHWSYDEMHNAFGITPEEFVWFGGYPGTIDLKADEARWKQYVLDALIETSISRDIIMLTRVDKPVLMKRLFELGCQYSGQILSFNKILGQLNESGNTTTLAHYLELLNSAGLLAGVDKFSIQKHRQRASSPKFQVHNTALITAQHYLKYNEAIRDFKTWGRWVESAIGAHLLNYSNAEGYELFYWRQRNNEIDFVITHRNKIIGLEVKSGVKQQAKGIDKFQEQYHPDKIYLIGESGIPWQEFLKINPIELF